MFSVDWPWIERRRRQFLKRQPLVATTPVAHRNAERILRL
jgi:hypothetical protein